MKTLVKPKALALAALAVALGLAAGCSKSEEGHFERDGYVLEAALKPNPPVVGDNTMAFELMGPNGEPVEGADISVRAFMPSMGAMPAMEAKGRGKETGRGRYEASFNLSMSGNWDLTLRAEKNGSEIVSFPLLVAPTRPGLIDPNAGMGAGMAHDHGAGTLDVPEPRRQLIGVRTALVEKRELSRPIRTVGRVEEDETKLWHVTVKFSGWIEHLFVDFTGALVHKGQALFTLYSQELYVSQQEYLDALGAYQKGQAPKSLLDAARERLTLWDLTDAQVEAIAKSGEANKYLTIYSPASGYVVEKNVTEGHEVKPGMRLYEIADLSSIWVIADVYEYEAPLVQVGSEASITEAYAAGPARKGVVDYIYPRVDERSRTLPVRLVFENEDLALKPGMFVNVKIETPLGVRVAVPEEAVLYSGEHRYVFVDLGDGRLEPREIEVGEKSENFYAVASGLVGGERVVTSGNFLISSEAQLKGALPKWKGAAASPAEGSEPSAPPMPADMKMEKPQSAPSPEGHEHHHHGGHGQ